MPAHFLAGSDCGSTGSPSNAQDMVVLSLGKGYLLISVIKHRHPLPALWLGLPAVRYFSVIFLYFSVSDEERVHSVK